MSDFKIDLYLTIVERNFTSTRSSIKKRSSEKKRNSFKTKTAKSFTKNIENVFFHITPFYFSSSISIWSVPITQTSVLDYSTFLPINEGQQSIKQEHRASNEHEFRQIDFYTLRHFIVSSVLHNSRTEIGSNQKISTKTRFNQIEQSISSNIIVIFYRDQEHRFDIEINSYISDEKHNHYEFSSKKRNHYEFPSEKRKDQPYFFKKEKSQYRKNQIYQKNQIYEIRRNNSDENDVRFIFKKNKRLFTINETVLSTQQFKESRRFQTMKSNASSISKSTSNQSRPSMKDKNPKKSMSNFDSYFFEQYNMPNEKDSKSHVESFFLRFHLHQYESNSYNSNFDQYEKYSYYFSFEGYHFHDSYEMHFSFHQSYSYSYSYFSYNS